jgi:hypothetical protein
VPRFAQAQWGHAFPKNEEIGFDRIFDASLHAGAFSA